MSYSRIDGMPSWVRRATIEVLWALALLLGACVPVATHPPGGSAPEPQAGTSPKGSDLGAIGSAPSPVRGGPVEFLFSSLDDRPVSSTGLRGKPSVLAFVASDELASQAEAGFLSVMAKNDGDRVNYALVAVEEEERRELVESFRAFFETKFGISLRTGMADKDTLLGVGPFGDVHRLTVVVLDPAGKIVWRRSGLAKVEELRAVLARL
jgi:hypothetical protein